MSVEQFVAILGAATALIVALTALVVQVAKLNGNLNGRMSELMQRTHDAAHKDGELAGRDFMRRLQNPPAE